MDKLLSLKILSNDINKNNESELKMKLIVELNTLRKDKNFTNIKAIFIMNPGYFGNRMIMLNNIIFYFEILNITNIYLNSKYNWIIKNSIITDKIKIFLMSPSKIDCNSINIICISFKKGFLFFPLIIKPELRISILKYEIKRNLPNVEIEPKALYIHIRSGDIFTNNINSDYAQPPLCFYRKIIYEFTFTKIYLISGSNNNPVINKLLIEFPSIIFQKNDIVQSIAYLSNAYNIVGSISSFLLMSIRLNNNLKLFWEYDLFKISTKFIFFHPDIYSNSINYIITSSVLALTTIVAISFQSISDYISLIGSFCTVVICFFVPGMIYIKGNDYPLNHYKNILTIIFISLILFIGITSGIFTIKGIIEK